MNTPFKSIFCLFFIQRFMTFPPCKKDLCSNECMLYYIILCYYYSLYLFCITNNYIFMISRKAVCLVRNL